MNTPFHFHGDIDAVHAHLDFAVNVRGDTPPWLVTYLSDHLADLAHYPQQTQEKVVRHALAHLHGVSPDSVVLLHGAAEGFSLVLRQPARRVLLVHPSFTEPDALAEENNKDIRRVLAHAPDFPLRSISLAPALSDGWIPDLIVLGNPTNPTGRIHARAEIDEFYEACAGREHNALLLVDEAFLDIAKPDETMIPRAARLQSHIIVLRSLTKTFALAGLRCGYAITSPELAHRLVLGRPQWPLGSLQLAAMEAVVSARGKHYVQEEREVVGVEKRAMISALINAGFTVFNAESTVPFLLVQPPARSIREAERWRHALLDLGVAVRRCDTFPGLDARYWRMAVREQLAVDAFLAMWEEISSV